MSFYTKFALHNILRHPIRSLITIVGIALGVAVILAVAMLNDTTRHSIERTIEELGSGKTDIWVEESGETTTSIGTRIEGFPEEMMQNVLVNPAVQSVHPALKIYALGVSERTQPPLEFYLYGIRFADDRNIRNHILSKGNFPANPQQILIGRKLAEAFGMSIGSRLTIQSPKGVLMVEIAGLLSPDEGSGLWHNNRIVFADLAVVQEFFHYENKITSLNIVLKSGAKPLDIAKEVQTLFPATIKVITDPLMAATKGDESVQLRVALLIYSFISILIAMFIIYNTLSSTIEQSRKEIGMLRLIGMTSQQTTRLFLRQALIYAVIGSYSGIALGLILGWGMVNLLQRIFAYQAFALIPPSIESLLTAFGTGLILTVVVALFPAIKSAKIPPLVVFREQETEHSASHRFTLRTMIGITLIVVAVVLGLLAVPGKLYAIIRMTAPIGIFIGLMILFDSILPFILSGVSACFTKVFGVPGMLAARSLQLRLRRTIITISAIVVAAAISIAVVGSVLNMKQTTTGWLDKTRWADVLIFSASGAEMDETILKRLQEFPFIRRINPIRYFFVPFDHPKLSDQGFLFQAVYPTQFQEFTRVEVEEGQTSEVMQRLEHNPAVLVNVGLAQMLGLKQGDTIRLQTQKGATDFSVAGSVVDYTDFVHRLGKIVYGSYHTLAEYWGAIGYTVLQIRLVQGYAQEKAKHQLLQSLSSTYDVKILTHAEEKADITAALDRLFASNYAITVMMFLIVFMGMFNTVFINVLFQLREFAILRTLGLLVRQIRLMVLCEALAMGLIGIFFAGFAGIWLDWQMMLGMREMIGIVFQFRMAWGLIGLTFALIPLIAIGATLYPQRIAAKLSIAQILQIEEQ